MRPFPDRLPIPQEVVAIARRLEEAGHEAWCVGGAIRDALLGDEHADFDIATSATPEEVQRLFRHTVAVGIKYGTVGVLDRRRRLHEVTTFRRDVSTDGRHAVVAFGASLEEDLARRDFTINAIAYHPLRGEWRDPFGGAADLERRRVRAVGTPSDRFREDYLRILRGVRFAARFGFTIEHETWRAARESAPGLRHLSAERVREEWFKGLRTARSVGRLVELWREVGAAAVWLPELPAPGEIPSPALAPAERDPVLLTTLLCPEPAAVLARLRASKAEIARADAAAAAPAGPDGTDPPAVRRWLAAVGDAAEDLLELWRLRHGAAAPWEPVAREVQARGDPLARKDLRITGRDLMEAGVPRGPMVGEILDRLLGRVVEDPSLNTREALLKLVREMV